MEDDGRHAGTTPERPLIRGERVWLRPIEERDLAAWRTLINDTEVGGWAGYQLPLSPEMARAFLERATARMTAGEAYVFTVCELGADTFIGHTRLKDVDYPTGSVELSISMLRQYIGGGWGADAQRALLRFAFGTLGLRRVWLVVDAENERAIRSYERVGFRREGLLREERMVKGRLADAVIMAILQREWLDRSREPDHGPAR